jgi:XRE family transcriptional regulator, regulator of sulfur utilization
MATRVIRKENGSKMTLGEKISIQRKRKGFTQETLSEITGVSLRTIQRIENNTSVPRAYTLKMLAEHLEMNVDELMEKQDISEKPASHVVFNRVSQQMNIAGLSVMLLPILPLLMMFVIWYKNKNNETSKSIGKRIMCFQILWLAATLFVLVCTKVVYYYLTGAHSVGHLSPLLPAYLLMLFFNLITVIYSAFKFQKQELGVVYRFVPLFF